MKNGERQKVYATKNANTLTTLNYDHNFTDKSAKLFGQKHASGKMKKKSIWSIDRMTEARSRIERKKDRRRRRRKANEHERIETKKDVEQEESEVMTRRKVKT